MAEVNLTIHGRTYAIACGDGQEKRVKELGQYVDQKMREIAKSGAATSDAHLLVLTSLILADESFDLRENVNQVRQNVQVGSENPEEEAAIAKSIEDLATRIDSIAQRIQSA